MKGKVEDTLPHESNLPQRIALLRLDTDFYSSTKAQLNTLLERMVPGAWLILDDYCSWEGQRRAMDEWLALPANAHRLEVIAGGKAGTNEGTNEGAQWASSPKKHAHCFIARMK